MLQLLRRLKIDGLAFLTNRLIARIPLHTIRLLFYRRCLGFKVDEGSLIFMDAWFDLGGRMEIGRNSILNQKCRIDTRGDVFIGDNVSISAETCILTADHDLQSASFSGRSRSVQIEDFVFVGTRAMIMPGVTLKRGCAVAAGAVVTKDIEPCMIVAGVPAKSIGTRKSEFNYSANYPRLFS